MTNKNNLEICSPSWHGNHGKLWLTIGSAINEVYGGEENPDSVLCLGLQNHQPLSITKERFPNRKLIAYQTEPLVENHWVNSEPLIHNLTFSDEVWDYDLENIRFLRSRGIDAKFKPPLYAESLKQVQNSDKPDIDVLFYGSLTPYRNEILSNFMLNSFITAELYELFMNMNVVVLNNFHGKELDEFIGRSKIILNLNPYAGQTRQQQVRIFYALINNKCVLSEKSSINYYDDMILEFSGSQELCDKVLYLLKDDNWKLYTENNFKSHSERVLLEGEQFFANKLTNLQQQ